ncbi:sensor histidine kinase [Gemmatimonas groenlandica]|uniref:sensor histidine kinase n=1 Tax=Gemmatimonas groenlandica TaxID=2732249 RepID=UPI00198197B2|nr:sensor histidine kinase [Gemmatimonas groenlandica]
MRFDGVRFMVIDGTREPALRLTGRAGRSFTPRHVDREHRLWIVRPDGGLVTYRNGVFRVAFDPVVGHARYTDVYEDGAGGIWVEADSAGRQWIRRLQGEHLVPGSWPAGVPDSGVTVTRPDTADGLWVGTRTQGIWHITPRGIRHFDPPPASSGLAKPERSVYPELQAADGTLWVSAAAGRGGLQHLRAGVWTPVHLDDDPRALSIGMVTQSPDGTVYIASRSAGVLVWRDGHLERRPPGDGAAGMVVQDIVADADGTIWATTDLGLERFRRAAFMTLGRRDGVPFDAPYEMAGDATGSIWVRDRSDNVYRLHESGARAAPDSLTGQRMPLPPALRFQLLAASRGSVWLGLTGGGLARVDGSGTTRVFRGTDLPPKRIWAGVEDADGALWLSTAPRGLGVLRNGRYAPVLLPGLGDNAKAIFVAADSQRRVIAADEQMPVAYAVSSSRAPMRLDSLTPLRKPLEAVAIEASDTLWGVVLPKGGGPDAPPTLVRLAGGRAVEVPLPGPVPGLTGFNVILSVAHDALWFASGGGVGRFPLPALHAAANRGLVAPAPQTFGPPDGLVSPHLTLYGVARMFRATDGRLWLATPGGLSVVDPAAVPVNDTPPPVHVEEVVVGAHELAASELWRIAPNPDRIEIHYTAASPRMPERVRVQYRLDGVDRDWVDGSVPRTATYTQLRPGAYRFRVRAWNEDGVPSTGEAVLAFTVLPAWYQTRWALALAVLAAGAVGAAGMGAVARTRRRRAEAELRGRLAERVRLARELHDTLLSGMTGISMRLDAAAIRASGPLGLDASVLGEMRTLARNTLVEARDAVTAMRNSADDLVPLWDQLADAARRTFADTEVDVRLEREGTTRAYPRDVEAEVVRIATEALVNARKHSACRSVKVRWVDDRRGLRVSVTDDGSGFDQRDASLNGHWGLQGMRERAAAVGATLTIDSHVGRGTDVVVSIRAPG